MNKELEAFEEIKTVMHKLFGGVERCEKSLDIVEKALDEHEQYKAIEQELGIDLVTLFKALKNGIYCLEQPGNQIVYLEPYFVGMDTFGVWHYTTKTTIKELKDYGKTWALDKNDLTKE